MPYLQLSHRGLAKVFGAGIDSKRDQIASIDALLSQTSFALLRPKNTLSLQLPGFPLCLCLTAWLEGRISLSMVCWSEAEDG